jgi:hypothetical protein
MKPALGSERSGDLRPPSCLHQLETGATFRRQGRDPRKILAGQSAINTVEFVAGFLQHWEWRFHGGLLWVEKEQQKSREVVGFAAFGNG